MNVPFSRLDDDLVFKAFREEGTKLTIKRGEQMLGPDDPPQHMFMLAEGFVKAYSINSRNEQYVHVIYDAGELFPLAWLINEVRRNVYYEAITDCTLYTLDRSIIAERAQTDAPFTYCMLQRTTEQFRVYADRVDNLEYKYASERLAYYLLFLAGRSGVKKDGRIILQAPITHQVLGSTINLSRESVTRELDKLVKKGLIEYQDRLIVIRDIEALKSQFKNPISPNWWGLNSLGAAFILTILHRVLFGAIVAHPIIK